MRLLLLSLFLCGCSFINERAAKARAWFQEDGKIHVVASTSMVADLVRMVGKERVVVWTLIGPGHDPHSYELVKGDSDFLERADLIVFNGLGLEHGASMQGISSKAFAVGEHLIGSGRLIYDEGTALDPHIWMDVALWSEGLEPLANRLAQLEPEALEFFHANAQVARGDLLRLHRDMREKLMGLPEEKRYLVTAHDAFRYFTRAYLGENWEGRLAAAEGLSPHGQVSLADLQDVAHFIREHRVGTIFPESYLSRAFLEKLLHGLGAKSRVSDVGLCADTMLEEADFDYMESMRHNARVIREALK